MNESKRTLAGMAVVAMVLAGVAWWADAASKEANERFHSRSLTVTTAGVAYDGATAAGQTAANTLLGDANAAIAAIQALIADANETITALNAKVTACNTSALATSSAQATLLATLSPAVITPYAAAATDTTWEDVQIAANTAYLHVQVGTESCYIQVKATRTAANGGADPAQVGCTYMVNGTYKIDCRGYSAGYVCFKTAANTGTITVTAFGN